MFISFTFMDGVLFNVSLVSVSWSTFHNIFSFLSFMFPYHDKFNEDGQFNKF